MAVNDTFVTIAAVAPSVVEGGDITFRITRTGNLSGPCSVKLNLQQPLGAPGLVDATPQVVNFAATVTQVQIPRATVNSLVTDGTRIIKARIGDTTGCTVVESKRVAQVTIVDTQLPTLSISSAANLVVEPESGTVQASFIITRGGDLTVSCDCRFTRSGTVVDADFQPVPPVTQIISFVPGQTTSTINMFIVADALVESAPFEEIIGTIDQPANCVIPSPTSQATITIDDRDLAMRARFDVEPQAALVTEQNTGSQQIGFRILRSGNLAVTASIGWTVTLGAGLNNTDFVTAPTLTGTMSFNSTVTSGLVSFDLRGDTTVESDEEMSILLHTPSANAELGSVTTSKVTILTDDTPPPSGFVKLLPMAVKDPSRAASIVDKSTTFNAQIDGYYDRDPPTTGPRPLPTCANPVTMTAVGQIADFRGCDGVQHDLRTIPAGKEGYQYTMYECVNFFPGPVGSLPSVMCGGKVHTNNAKWLSDPWAGIHGDDTRGFNAPGIWISDTRGIYQGFYLKDTMDGLVIRGDGWQCENMKIHARDDAIENDDQYSGTIRNAYILGHSLLSVRPGTGSRSLNNLRSITRFENCIIDMQRQPYDGDEKAHSNQTGADYGHRNSQTKNPYTNPSDSNRHTLVSTSQLNSVDWFAGKSLFKSTVVNTTNHLYFVRVHMINCIIRMTGMAVEGPDKTYFPGIGDGQTTAGANGSKYENVKVCVVAAGGWNGISTVQTAAYLENTLGITVINKDGTDELNAYNQFKAVVDEWNLVNDYQLTTDTCSWNRK